MNLFELKALIDESEDDMTAERALKVIQNEKECILNQYNGECDNKRDCENCYLALEKDEILNAYDFMIETLKKLDE